MSWFRRWLAHIGWLSPGEAARPRPLLTPALAVAGHATALPVLPDMSVTSYLAGCRNSQGEVLIVELEKTALIALDSTCSLIVHRYDHDLPDDLRAELSAWAVWARKQTQ